MVLNLQCLGLQKHATPVGYLSCILSCQPQIQKIKNTSTSHTEYHFKVFICCLFFIFSPNFINLSVWNPCFLKRAHSIFVRLQSQLLGVHSPVCLMGNIFFFHVQTKTIIVQRQISRQNPGYSDRFISKYSWLLHCYRPQRVKRTTSYKSKYGCRSKWTVRKLFEIEWAINRSVRCWDKRDSGSNATQMLALFQGRSLFKRYKAATPHGSLAKQSLASGQYLRLSKG